MPYLSLSECLTCIMWDFGCISFVPQANEMAMSNFQPLCVSNIVILLVLEENSHRVMSVCSAGQINICGYCPTSQRPQKPKENESARS